MRKILLFAALTFAGCHSDPQSTTTIGNDIKLEKMFEHDGCTMYRFADGGRYIYWSTCPGRASYDAGKQGVIESETTTEQ